MMNLKNKGAATAANHQVRRTPPLQKVPLSYHLEPICGGCGLLGLKISRPGGFGVVRFYALSRGWREAPLYFCESCVEQYTGSKPYGE
jgi:hypothetical protein